MLWVGRFLGSVVAARAKAGRKALPERVEPLAHEERAEREDGADAVRAPALARALGSSGDQRLARALGDAASRVQTVPREGGVVEVFLAQDVGADHADHVAEHALVALRDRESLEDATNILSGGVRLTELDSPLLEERVPTFRLLGV